MSYTNDFVCDTCNAVDNIFATQQTNPGRWECHECQTGHWHDQFPKREYNEYTDGPMLNRVSNNDDGLSVSFS